MESRKPSRAPIGKGPLAVGAFLALFAIVFIGHGIRDIRRGEGAGPLFFLGWLVFIGVVVYFYPKLTAKKTPVQQPPTDSSGFDSRNIPHGALLFLVQDTLPPAKGFEGCDGMVSCHPWIVVVIVVAVVAVAVGIARYNKGRP